jgi:ornithine carbamoyltransferase
MKDLLRTSDLSTEDLTLLLDRAAELARDPSSHQGLLRGDSLVLFFEKPSTRTRLSFETAIARLGGHSVFVAPSDLQLSRGETIEDTARTASRHARAWIMRAARHEDVERFARAATLHVVNALTNRHHPCQSLADLLTIRHRFGQLAGVRVAWVGAANNVATSFVEGATMTGMHVRIASPPALSFDAGFLAHASELARESRGSIEVHVDPRAAVAGAEVVYTDVWSSMSDDPSAAAERRAALEAYRVDAALMKRAARSAIFLHCLPCRRGEEVAADVVDGPASVVFDQAENRLHTAAAVLDALIRSELVGRR